MEVRPLLALADQGDDELVDRRHRHLRDFVVSAARRLARQRGNIFKLTGYLRARVGKYPVQGVMDRLLFCLNYSLVLVNIAYVKREVVAL